MSPPSLTALGRVTDYSPTDATTTAHLPKRLISMAEELSTLGTKQEVTIFRMQMAWVAPVLRKCVARDGCASVALTGTDSRRSRPAPGRFGQPARSRAVVVPSRSRRLKRQMQGMGTGRPSRAY
jgi:hypothetical protein